MIIRHHDELHKEGRLKQKHGVWSSARYLLRDDNVGFTLTQTTVAAGQSQIMQYKHHIEANLIIEGEAVLTDLASGETHTMTAGSMYTLDKHDRHQLDATTDLRIVCVFTPALYGTETHDEHGSYPLPDDLVDTE